MSQDVDTLKQWLGYVDSPSARLSLGLQLVEAKVITIPEFREAIGLTPEPDDDDDLDDDDQDTAA